MRETHCVPEHHERLPQFQSGVKGGEVMVYHIMCEVPPGREKELDDFLVSKMKKFWLSNPGVSRFHVYGDHLANKLERVITIEVGDFANFDKILALDERKEL